MRVRIQTRRPAAECCACISAPLRRPLLQRSPSSLKEGAGDSLGPCDAEYLEGNEKAKDWLVRFMKASCVGGLGGV